MKSTLIAASVAFAAVAGTAEAVSFSPTWTITGTGDTNQLAAPFETALYSSPNFNYDAEDANSGSWTITGLVSEGGDFFYEWFYSFNHAWFQAEASLSVTTGGVETVLFSGSSYGDTSQMGQGYLSLVTGNSFVINIAGSNFDSSAFLRGGFGFMEVEGTPVTLPAVPLPATSLGLLGALGALAFARKRKSA